MNRTKLTRKAVKNNSIYDVKINRIDGVEIDLSAFRGKKILFVNVASECGFTKQYSELQKLSDLYPTQLVVIGCPCDQFGGQEPGNATEIQSFCKKKFGITFLLTEKLMVKGPQQHELFTWLTKKSFNGKKNVKILWNFQKIMVDENGQFVDYFYSTTNPNSSKITRLI